MSRLAHLLCALALLAPAACVADADADTTASALGGGSGHPPPRPPKEAVDACTGHDAGDACAFDHDGHHVTGTCTAGPDADKPLACKPDQPPPPPPEAFAACDGASAGDPCDVTTPDGDTIDGSCVTGPQGDEPLACAP